MSIQFLTGRQEIQEQLVDLYVVDQPKVEITYRVVVSVQHYENYGWCDWDGNGPCPQRWKAKGGSDYIVVEGLSEKDMLTTDPMSYVPEGIGHKSEGFEEMILGVEFLPSNVPTYEETMVKDMMEWGGMRRAEADRILAGAKRFMAKE